MDEKFKDEWVSALDSGQYEQYEGGLKDKETGALCALGVAAELLVQQEKAEWMETAVIDVVDAPYPSGLIGAKPYHTRIIVMQGIKKRGGIGTGNPLSLGGDLREDVGLTEEQTQQVVKWNDSNKLPFHEIALKIKEEF